MIMPQDLNPLAGPVEGDSLGLKAVLLPVTEFRGNGFVLRKLLRRHTHFRKF
jgi:hypothetical protein